MAVRDSTCPICSDRMVAGAYGVLERGEMAHPQCRVFTQSVNRWPGGVRQLLCLSCGRAFESESKGQRICKGCRSRHAAA